MDTKSAYNKWATTYDTVDNKTRDLEEKVIRQVLSLPHYYNVIEIGCGTGKNTQWLASKSSHLTCVDFSNEMISIAKKNNSFDHVNFVQADISQAWEFPIANLITFSLVLEHIQNIDFIFQQANKCLEPGGQIYICELHPYKQLSGSRAKFEHEGKLVQLEYFIHHISEFYRSAKENGFDCTDLKEWFDDGNESPRLVSFLFMKRIS